MYRQKNQLHRPWFLGDNCKDIQTSHFGYFGHAWLHTFKVIVLSCKRLQCLSGGQK